MYRIWKSYHFAAAHRLWGVPKDHKCARVHGHNYLVEVELEAADLDEAGFVVDFGDLWPIKDFIDEHWDHRDLNEALYPHHPTAEVIARFLFDTFASTFPQMVAVRVRETDTSWAEWRP